MLSQMCLDAVGYNAAKTVCEYLTEYDFIYVLQTLR